MANPQLVTHHNPHLDDVAAIWILKRFLPKWKNARTSFIHADTGTKQKDTASRLYIGVGQGQFDEHKGDKEDSATTLVWKYCKKQKACKVSTVQRRALEELTDYVNDEDHGLLFEQKNREFMIGSVFSYLPEVTEKGSKGTVDFGLLYLDAVFAGLVQKHILMNDWKRRKEFKTRWGKGVAVTTRVSSQVVARVAYSKGYTLFVYRNTKSKYTSIKAKNTSRVNLTKAYKAVKELEPKAEWYFHHSKKMLICGSDVAANMYLSKLKVKDVIALTKL